MPRVLIIDDAAFMRLAIRRMLEKHGFEIVGEAENGNVGIKKYIELMPEVVTMDITMPELGGIEALKAILKHDPKAKVVIVSAMGQEEMVKEAVMYGAKTFIVKPIIEEHMVRILTKITAI